MPASSFLLLGRPHAGTGWLALQLAIGMVLCAYAWQALLAAHAQRAAPTGIDDDRVLVVPWFQPAHGEDPGSASVVRTLRALPDVESVAVGNQTPYGTSAWSAHVWAGDEVRSRPLATVYLADEAFLSTLGLAPSQGRRFATSEYQDYTGDQRRLHTDPAPALLSAALAQRLYGTADPVGRTLQVLPGKQLRVVGVIPTIPLPATAHRPDGTALVLPVRMTRAGDAHFFVRHTGHTDALAMRIRSQLAARYPDAAIAAPVSLMELRAHASSGAMRHAWTSVIACLAWWLSTLGMLVLGGHRWVHDHRQELSLRRAFGASSAQLAHRLRWEYLLLAAVAALSAVIIAAVLLPRLVPAWMASASSPWILPVATVVTAVLVQLAATWPARMVRRIPPHLVSRSPSVRL
ncbi:ABC transporter permease [Pseudoxanthomonas sp. PXM02]|uniref:ABC transporter permease n=1 Tax=Pseudoxanthomonas sp. PXM02 TaxID=2769294 RepID=UPI001783F456|nr:ABC transporter permease [Pseudoxanthomonas sp. PXM02]MBD9480940.1 ABC transporter permease [Pseudoxanthomonas sp. PXM02]